MVQGVGDFFKNRWSISENRCTNETTVWACHLMKPMKLYDRMKHMKLPPWLGPKRRRACGR
jgi:hypothetical protein